jgi:hypothetical protein
MQVSQNATERNRTQVFQNAAFYVYSYTLVFQSRKFLNRSASKRRISQSLELLAVNDVRRSTEYTRPSTESQNVQRLMINLCISPILAWSEQAERQGALGRLTALRNDIKDC